MGIPDHLTYLLRNLFAGQEATVRTRPDWLQIVKYIKTIYCHPAYLIYIQSTSYKMFRLHEAQVGIKILGDLSIASDMQITPLLWKKVKSN